MSVFDGILIVVSMGLIGLLFIKKQPSLFFLSIVGSVVALLIVLQGFIESVKWQVYPFYGGVLLVGFILYIQTRYGLKRWVRGTLLTLSVVLFLLSSVALYVFPVYDLPEPTGIYDIGTTSYTVNDHSREELYNGDVDTRTIKIQLWYPAETTDGYEQVPWLEDGRVVARALAVDTGLPAFVLDHTTSILSHSYKDAAINTSETSYPVIIISHGWRGFRNLHNDFAEELASHGYIVVSIDHTYGTVATVFDGTVAPLNLEALPLRNTTPDFLEYANTLVNTYGDDVITTLNYLEDLQDGTIDSMFTGVLDVDSIGVVGHSTGGGGDVAAALKDDRIDAVFGLDAWVESIDETLLEQGLDIPSVFVRSGAWEESYNNEQLYTLIDNSPSSILYQVDGTTHYDFSMVYMYSPLTGVIGFTGDVDGRYLNTILETMMVDFFDETLQNDTMNPLDISPWDEVREILIPE
ncbi:alpha/beta hydrolase family protein [Candidatus Xianfuyuplasma coldseepsis]|uniref:Platelet-activating factor acetylhydrolase n=1 Tax=Candidatus Xianfuyuplasma coldseepsis TaxID=2782163 RepID=A0A7L7KT66_9MOLU|nr:dienelactone hydrolase family protein [Xianfuyuplasma coldseepsis]QMS85144.1 hypothetical protein G4Z02_05090 [Xianfuyuplasma coldseepsis]